jgi:hypothetical protein
LGWQIRTGIRIYARDEATAIVKGAVDRGFAVATHAIGNEAIDTALGAYESAGAALSRRARPRLEHAMFLDRETVRRIAGVGAAVVTQPNFLAVPAIASAASIPRVRNMPLRWLLDAGVAVAGSSDFPVAGFDPLDAIRAAVTRRTAIGRTYEPDQCITVDEALTLYTRTAAEVSGAGDRCGTLEAGKRADLLVLSGPISTPASLEGVRVASTVLAGDVVFGEPGTPSAR